MKGRWIKSDPLMGSTGREDFRGTGKVTTPPSPAPPGRAVPYAATLSAPPASDGAFCPLFVPCARSASPPGSTRPARPSRSPTATPRWRSGWSRCRPPGAPCSTTNTATKKSACTRWPRPTGSATTSSTWPQVGRGRVRGGHSLPGGTFPAVGSGAGAAFPAWHMLVRQERAAAFWEQLKAASLPAWALGTIPGTGERGTALPRCGLDCCGAQILSKGAAPSFSGASRVVLIPPVRGVCSLGGTCRDLNS